MLNKVFLLGTIGDKGVECRPVPDSGTMVASFLLKLTETNEAGRVFTSYHLIEAFGKALQTAETLDPGDLISVEGKLRRKKISADRWETFVLALAITKVHLPVAIEG